MARHRRPFTILELLVVMGVIAILAAMLLPILGIARSKARYARWLGYKNGLRTHSNLAALYDFEQDGDELMNLAVGPDEVKNYLPDSLNVPLTNPEWVEGRWHGKKALHFDNDTYGMVEDLPRYLPDVHTSMSILWWFKSDDTSDRQCVLDMRPEGPGSAVQPGMENGRVTVWRSGGSTLVQAPEAAEAEKWTQAAYILEVDSMMNFTNTLYINGNEVASTANPPHSGKVSRLWLGRYSGGGEIFKGAVDQLMIFNAPLTEQEIVDDFQMGNPR